MLWLKDASADQISCEKVEIYDWSYGLRNQTTCFMDEVTAIDSPDFIILSERDETVGGLRFAENRNISYLPSDVYKNFPGLLGIDATSCSIKVIKKENLNFLYNLTMLWLRDNQIESIGDGSFDALTLLQGIDLRKKYLFFQFSLTLFFPK